MSDDPDARARERGVQFDHCLSFTVRGHWGHFRRVDGNRAKQTYRVIPRTTAAGLTAAILGLERDSYYDLFGPDASALAITPEGHPRTMRLPMNALSTDEDGMETVPSARGKGLKVTYPNGAKKNRQQHNYEFLVEPAYRLDLWLDDEATYAHLREKLANGESHYAPSLGLSECLATIDYHGEFAVDRVNADAVDSAIPGGSRHVVPSPDTAYGTERSPGFMEADTDGVRTRRRTTGFIDWAYAEDAIDTTDIAASEVDGRAVVFS